MSHGVDAGGNQAGEGQIQRADALWSPLVMRQASPDPGSRSIHILFGKVHVEVGHECQVERVRFVGRGWLIGPGIDGESHQDGSCSA